MFLETLALATLAISIFIAIGKYDFKKSKS